jgi:tetratricopeptide (TPR) repeat protein
VSFVLFAVTLAGCSSLFSTTHGADETVESDVWMRKAQPSPDSEAVFQILSGELAGQAGQYDEALDHYLKAARLTRHPKVAERATQIALFAKDPAKALEAASLWSQADPGNAGPKRIAAILNLKQGNIETGVAQLRALLTLRGVELESTLIELVKMLDAELPKEQAFEVMQRLERALPKMPEIHLAYALLATNKGEYPLALEQLKHALTMHPRWGRAQVLQAQVMAQMGDSAAARDVIRKALQDDPKNDRLRLMLAQLLTKTNDLAGAERELVRVLSQDPGNADARMGLAMVLLESGREDKAKAELRRMVSDEKWQSQASFYLGIIEARQGRPREAVAWFDRVESGPNEFDAKVNAITALMGLGRWEEARERLNDLRTRYPQEALKLYLLEADLLVKRREYQAAFDLLTSALGDMPDQPELLYTRALVAEHLKRPELLESDLRAVLAKHPNDVNALNALGFTLTNRGERLDEAESLLRQALQQKPDDPAIMDSWGWLMYRKGRLPEALDYLQRAYKRVPDPEIAAHLGEVLWEMGRRAEARRVWGEAAREAPDHAELKRIRAKYRDALPR